VRIEFQHCLYYLRHSLAGSLEFLVELDLGDAHVVPADVVFVVFLRNEAEILAILFSEYVQNQT